MRSIAVPIPQHPYDIQIAVGSLPRVGAAVRDVCHGTRRAVLAVDRAVAATHGLTVQTSLADAGMQPMVIELEASEPAKSLASAEAIWRQMLAAGLDRTTVVVALGGGVVGDLAGFVAACFMRGVDCVQVPTTLLGMVDAAVGGKSAVNLELPGGSLAKNMIGAFRQPRRVICDVSVLATLPDRVFRAGLAECLKHAMIADEGLESWIVAEHAKVSRRDVATLEELVARSVAVKAAIVAHDEREEGERALLNLGHTFAHAIEGHFHDLVPHGEAVALGLVAATQTSRSAGIWKGADPARVSGVLGSLGLPVRLPSAVPLDPLLALMGLDKKRKAGRWRLILPVAPGACRVVEDPPREAVAAGWRSIGAAG